MGKSISDYTIGYIVEYIGPKEHLQGKEAEVVGLFSYYNKVRIRFDDRVRGPQQKNIDANELRIIERDPDGI